MMLNDKMQFSATVHARLLRSRDNHSWVSCMTNRVMANRKTKKKKKKVSTEAALHIMLLIIRVNV